MTHSSVLLGDLAYLFYYLLLRALALVLLPIVMIWLMIELRVFFWLFIVAVVPCLYMVARRLKKSGWR